MDDSVKTFGHPPVPVQDVVDADGNTYCQVHTDTQTGLRCNNCGRLMCAKCAVQTPVGYRCQQCVRQREQTFYNADTLYYVKLVGVIAVMSAAGAFFAQFIGFFIFVFFISAAAAGVISEAALRVTKAQRGAYAGPAAAAAVVLGALITLWLTYQSIPVPPIIAELQAQGQTEAAREILAQVKPSFITFALSQLSVIIYTGITAVTVYGRFNIFGRR